MPHHRVTWSGATSPARRANGDAKGDANGNVNGDVLGDAGRRDVGPYHALPPHPMVGRDVPGAPRARERISPVSAKPSLLYLIIQMGGV